MNKEYSFAAFIDIEGAFNNITPMVITGALTVLGIERPIMGLLHTTLTSWAVYSTQQTRRGLSVEDPRKGILPPLLWVIVVNKLLSLLEESGTKVVDYADDVVILLQGKFHQTLWS